LPCSPLPLHRILSPSQPLQKDNNPSPRTTLASTRKRVRFCCSVKPSQLWWGLLPICTINEIFRTIPPTFRRGVGLPLPLHRPSPFLQSLQKNTYHLPCSPLPLHRILSPSQPLQKDNNPSPRTKLASLVKGRWLDGKAQTIALLRFTCNTSAFLFTKLFCRQDGGIAIPPFAQHHIYVSLAKGEVLSPEKNRATTGGIASPPSLALHQPFQNCTIPRPAPPLPPLPKVRCCRPKKIGRLPEGLPHHYPSPLTNPPEPALSHA